MPAILDRAHLETFRAAFLREYDPVGPTETAIVMEMARHARAMELWGEALGAVERRAASRLASFAWPGSARDELENAEAILAAAMTVDGVQQCDRHGLAHGRAFLRASKALREIQARRREKETSRPTRPPAPFAGEAACESYLRQRFARGCYRCNACGCARGYLVSGKLAWQCGRCRRQTGLRAGTVMARSRLPLFPWFEGIRWLLFDPTMYTAELASKLDIRRPTTVRSMAKRIRAAFGAEDASAQLAGLDVHYAKSKQFAEQSVRLAKRNKVTRKRQGAPSCRHKPLQTKSLTT
jgi:hypothetical protein